MRLCRACWRISVGGLASRTERSESKRFDSATMFAAVQTRYELVTQWHALV